MLFYAPPSTPGSPAWYGGDSDGLYGVLPFRDNHRGSDAYWTDEDGLVPADTAAWPPENPGSAYHELEVTVVLVDMASCAFQRSGWRYNPALCSSAPSQPSGAAAVPQPDGSVVFGWQPSVGARSYRVTVNGPPEALPRVERRNFAPDFRRELMTARPTGVPPWDFRVTDTELAFEGLVPGVNYTFTVAGLAASGAAGPGTTVTASPASGPSPDPGDGGDGGDDDAPVPALLLAGAAALAVLTWCAARRGLRRQS